jgi:hypothetical protein
MDWNKAIQYAQLVNAAYSAFLNTPYLTPGFDVLATIFANDLATDENPNRGRSRVVMGLILQAQGGGDAVVAIRGTEGIKEWVQDAQFLDTPFLAVPGAGRTEDGFTAMYESMKVGEAPGAQIVVRALPGVPWKRAVTSLTICGHSLGGALATLFALDAAANAPAPFKEPTVYTYASPRTGNLDFVAKYNQMISTTYRFVDNVDLVPKLPLDPPYKHVCAQIEMDSLTLIPPRIRLQPNPVCWHILSSYMYLMSLYSGGATIPPEDDCKPGLLALGKDILNLIHAELNDEESIKQKFHDAERHNMGAN